MVNDPKNILVATPGTTGGIFMASGVVDLADMPTDATTALNAAFGQHGYVSDAGVKRTVGRTTEDIKAWGGDTVRVVQTEHNVEISFALLEFKSLASQKLLRGDDNVTQDGTTNMITSKITSLASPERSLVIVMFDGEDKIRLTARRAQLSDEGEEQFVHAGVTSKEVTFKVMDPGDGNKMIDYIQPAA